MRSQIVLSSLVFSASASALNIESVARVSHHELDLQKWSDFKNKFDKNYENDGDHDRHFDTFIRHLRKFEQHNADASKTYKMGINQFTDLSFEQFSEKMLMRQPKKMNPLTADGQLPYPEEAWEMECPRRFEGAEIPSEFENFVDWRDKTANPLHLVADVGVKNQASCGSCYVFSAVAAIEAHLCMQGLYNCETFSGISEQQILNCGTYDEKMGDRTWERYHGCSGGWQSNVYQYVYRAGGVTCADHMPYESGVGDAFNNRYNVGQCPYTYETQFEFMQKYSHAFVNKKICGTTNKGGSKDPVAMKEALYSQGPLAVGMYVGDNFRHVESGIFVPPADECPDLNTSGINHAMAAVAYGVDEDSNLDYWVIKNSWGETYAEGGYAKVVRGQNACGVEGNVSYTEVGKPDNGEEEN